MPTLLVGLGVTGMALPGTPGPWLVGLVSVVLGMCLSYLLVFALNIVGLWLVETRGLQVLYMAVAGFLSGLYIPVTIFPGWLELLARATPFPAMLMTPVEILAGRVAGVDALLAVGAQLGWIAVVGGLGHLLTRAGRRHLEVQGG